MLVVMQYNSNKSIFQGKQNWKTVQLSGSSSGLKFT